MRHFVTLFDAEFLNRGLALYHSIAHNHPEPFVFHVLALDDETCDILIELALPNLAPIRLSEVEDEDLRATKATRSMLEYYWTLSAWSTWYVMKENQDAESVTYLDADLYFYAPLTPLYTAFDNHSVMIMPHRVFWNAQKREERAGKYNVSMVAFRNDVDGNECLSWWKDRCIEWCYNRVEPTRFGDQKYLDYFEEKFKGVYALPWKGVNLARWSIGAFLGKITRGDTGLMIEDEPLYFFHFSAFKIYYPPSSWLPWGPPSLFTLPAAEKDLLYRPYAIALENAMCEIRHVRPNFIGGTLQRPWWYRQITDMALLMLKRLSGRFK